MATPVSYTSFLRPAGALFAALVLAVGAARGILLLNDLSGMNHVGGIWMTLAQYLNDGVFYPPLQDDGYYAGTRYMPLLFGAIAVVGRVTGNYLLAAKGVTFLATAALAALTGVAAWHSTRRRLDALALAGLVLAFPEGLRALLSPHADSLAVALSVAGLLAVAGTPARRARAVLAAALFALAFTTKFSALAAPVAAIAFGWPRDRKTAFTLAAVEGGLVVAALALVQLASNGRFAENFRALGGGGMNWDTLRNGPARLAGALAVSSHIAFVAPLVVPLALLTVFQKVRARGLTLWDWYFLASVATTLLIFTSPGTDPNHLLEMEVTSVLVVAQRFAPTGADALPVGTPDHAPLARLVVLAALVVAWYTLITTEPEPSLPFAVLAKELPKEPHLLTEDATPVVLLGQRPVVMDAFAFRLLAERNLIDDAPLARRIDRREFNGLVLLRRVENPEERLTQFHFGPQVTNALRRAYRFDKQLGQYYLYVPEPAAGSGPALEGK